MLFEFLELFVGMIKILFYKIIYYKRINFKSIPKINKDFKIAIKKQSKLVIGKKFRARNNISFRIYNSGVINIGNNCFFNDNCSLNCQKRISIGDNVIIGQNVLIFDHDHDYKGNINNFIKKEVEIGNNVWIGANVIILKGVTIGDNAVVAAGTIVKNDINANNLVYQNREILNKEWRN